MTKREISGSGIILIILVASFAGIGLFMAYQAGWFESVPFLGGVTPVDGEPVDLGVEDSSRFSVIFDKEDDVATLVASETAVIWCDWNGDGIMQTGTFAGYSAENGLVGGELEPCASVATTAVMTSPSPYPFDRDIWIFVDTGKDVTGRDYQLKYAKFVLTGEPNTDGSAKALGSIHLRATDDAITYSSIIGAVTFSKGTDYNYTLSGAEDSWEIRCKLVTADAGVSSGTHPAFYSGSGSFYNWLNGKDYAPTFMGMYMTNQDFIDLGMDTTGYDLVYQGASNTYLAKFVDDSDPNMFYDSDDSAAPTISFHSSVDISAAGVILYLGIWQDVEWSDFVLGIWGTADDQTLGTADDDYVWVA